MMQQWADYLDKLKTGAEGKRRKGAKHENYWRQFGIALPD